MVWLLLFACTSDVQEPQGPPPEAATPSVVTEPADADARAPVPHADRVAVRHILVSHREASTTMSRQSRSRDDARQRATDLREQLLGGADFEQLAQEHSDDASAPQGGFLGSGERGTWVPAFEQAAFALHIGELSAVVETPFGFHVLRRDPLEEVRLQHIVVQHSASHGLVSEQAKARTEEQAVERAQQILERLEQGEDLVDLAKEMSDGPLGARGADLGWFLRGELGPDFDEAAFSLEPGQHSQLVRTVFGVHVIRRVE